MIFLSLEHLEGIAGLLIDLIFNIIFSQGIGKPEKKERNGKRPVRTHTTVGSHPDGATP